MAKQTFKLDLMALAELVQLRDEVEAVLGGKIEMERQQLQVKLAEIDKLQSGSKPRASKESRRAGNGATHPTGKKADPKYRGPSGETWAGRGLTPRWLVELEAKGKKREQFLIKK